MGIVRWNPSLVNRVFDDFFNADFPTMAPATRRVFNGNVPAVNVKETEDDFQLELAAPGFKKEDFKVEVDEGVLTISVEKEAKTEEDNDGYTRREFRYESFQRRFTLPETADDAGISAQYTDGILNIVLPKKEEAKPQPARLIEIG